MCPVIVGRQYKLGIYSEGLFQRCLHSAVTYIHPLPSLQSPHWLGVIDTMLPVINPLISKWIIHVSIQFRPRVHIRLSSIVNKGLMETYGFVYIHGIRRDAGSDP